MRILHYILTSFALTLLLLLGSAHGNSVTAARRSTMPDTLSRSYRHIDAVKRLSIHRDTLGAIDIWHNIIAEDSTYAPALYYLSRIEHDKFKVLKYAYEAFRADSTNKWYTENYASKLVATGLYSRAIPIYRRLMRLDARNMQSYYALAIIYGTSGMPYSAIAILDSAELRMGYNPYLADIKQHLLLDTHQYERAIEAGQRRIAEHPYDSEALTTLAQAYEAAGRDSLAGTTYERAFRLDTTDVNVISLITDYYYRKGDTERMLDYDAHLFSSPNLSVDSKLQRLTRYTSDRKTYRKYYLRIRSIMQGLAIDYPNHRGVVDAYAEHLLAGGDYAYALEYLRRHLDDESTTAIDYISVLQLEALMRNNELLQEDLQRALERFPDSLDILIFSGYILSDNGDYKGAIERFKSGLKHTSTGEEHSNLLGSIGDVYHEIGKDRSAFKYYRRALKHNADNALVLNNYAYFLSLMDKRLDRAYEMSSRAVALEPDNASYVDTHAWVLHRLGRNEEAKRVMRQALTLSGQREATLLMHYGDILWALGETFMAETYWQNAVERGYDREEMDRHIEEIKATE